MKKKINIINASFGYSSGKREKVLLSGINISAEEGENIALIGVNGSGKSTFLRTLAKLQPHLSGSVFIEDREIHQYSIKEFAKINGFVSSEIVMADYLSVYDLIGLGRFPHQNLSTTMTQKDREWIHTAMEITDINHLKDNRIDKISDGERQKVMIARALAQDTDIILLDEPTSFLDLSNKFSVYNLLNEISSNQNKTIIFSTHDLNIALKYADKIWLIKNGKIYEGAPEDLIINNIFIDLFENKIVYFNNETNEFTIKFEKKIPIQITNNSTTENLLKLTENALMKKGYYRVDEPTEVSIRINEDDTWSIIQKTFESKYESIYNTVRNILNKK